MKLPILPAAVATFSLAVPTAPALAQEELVLHRASDWNLHYAEDSCVLRRAFANGEQNAVLELRQFAPSTYVRFMVLSGTLEPQFRTFAYRLHPDAETKEGAGVFEVEAPDGEEGVIFSGSLLSEADDFEIDGNSEDSVRKPIGDDELRARESLITGIGIRGTFEQDVFLETGSLGPPMEAMRGCLDELLTHWDIDVEAHRTLSRRVTPLRENRWVGRIMNRFPTSGLVRGEQAVLNLRVIVNAQGEVDDCRAQSGIGVETFAEFACDQINRHAEFAPALDADGNAITSYWTTTITYQIR